MKARDVMVSPVVTARASASVKEVAQILVQHRNSAPIFTITALCQEPLLGPAPCPRIPGLANTRPHKVS